MLDPQSSTGRDDDAGVSTMRDAMAVAPAHDAGSDAGERERDAQLADADAYLPDASDEVPAEASDGSVTPQEHLPFAPVFAIFEATCTPCHNPGEGGQLRFETPRLAYEQLVDRLAEGPCANGRSTRVRAGNAERSLLVQKLGPAPPCGFRMPMNAEPLSTADIAVVVDWINDGAHYE